MPNWARKGYKFIVHHNTLTAITFLLFGVGCYFVYKSTETDKIGTIASMATALAIIVAMIQLLASNRQHRENSRRAAAEKAIEIARHFQSSLVHPISFLTVVLRIIGQTKYEQEAKLETGDLRFTKDELIELFGEQAESEFHSMQKKLTVEVFSQAAVVADRVVSAEGKELTPADQINMCNDFVDKRLDMLNTLEWIAMMLRTGVADERIVYQSLHQVLLRYIRLEYPYIATFNTDQCASGQFYTNLIWLYNTWQSRKIKKKRIDVKNEANRVRALQRTVTKNMRRRNKNVNCPPTI